MRPSRLGKSGGGQYEEPSLPKSYVWLEHLRLDPRIRRYSRVRPQPVAGTAANEVP